MTIQPTLFLSVLFAFVSACIYGYVGWRLSKRVIPSFEARVAWVSFTAWWYGLAITTLLNALLNLFGALGVTSLPLYITATHVNILVSCVALGGLLYYLLYLFTGNRRSLIPTAVFYMIFYFLLTHYISVSMPNQINVGRWETTLAYRTPLPEAFVVIVLAFLLLPQIICGFAYFSLYFRVHEATQKYRVLLVSWSIIIWFLSPVLTLTGGMAEQDWWQIVSRLIGLMAAFMILVAYLPPRWLKQRYDVVSLDDEIRQGQ